MPSIQTDTKLRRASRVPSGVPVAWLAYIIHLLTHVFTLESAALSLHSRGHRTSEEDPPRRKSEQTPAVFQAPRPSVGFSWAPFARGVPDLLARGSSAPEGGVRPSSRLEAQAPRAEELEEPGSTPWREQAWSQESGSSEVHPGFCSVSWSAEEA